MLFSFWSELAALHNMQKLDWSIPWIIFGFFFSTALSVGVGFLTGKLFSFVFGGIGASQSHETILFAVTTGLCMVACSLYVTWEAGLLGCCGSLFESKAQRKEREQEERLLHVSNKLPVFLLIVIKI